MINGILVGQSEIPPLRLFRPDIGGNMPYLSTGLVKSEAEAAGTFLPVDSDGLPVGFNEICILYKSGLVHQQVEVNAIVDRAALEGRNIFPGDGPGKEEDSGRRYRHTITIAMPADTDVDELRQPPDAFRVFTANDWSGELTRYRNGDLSTGEIYQAKHVHGTDEGMLDVECIQASRVTRRREDFNG